MKEGFTEEPPLLCPARSGALGGSRAQRVPVGAASRKVVESRGKLLKIGRPGGTEIRVRACVAELWQLPRFQEAAAPEGGKVGVAGPPPESGAGTSVKPLSSQAGLKPSVLLDRNDPPDALTFLFGLLFGNSGPSSSRDRAVKLPSGDSPSPTMSALAAAHMLRSSLGSFSLSLDARTAALRESPTHSSIITLGEPPLGEEVRLREEGGLLAFSPPLRDFHVMGRGDCDESCPRGSSLGTVRGISSSSPRAPLPLLRPSDAARTLAGLVRDDPPARLAGVSFALLNSRGVILVPLADNTALGDSSPELSHAPGWRSCARKGPSLLLRGDDNSAIMPFVQTTPKFVFHFPPQACPLSQVDSTSNLPSLP
eukprot:CAMPEP_0114116892 /NCGR_PEP_ID=MMETSP0043_2-20121206/4740_1 /TAXON_ID=464988 /ORGANISM="Hemiselmis andersenii, Strain CCMP644" /LENGTH=367 /DNA_ID=CAMNT_0001209243 /DNA_START=102 /DNA_END=1204 /DNA_ORIENTATION=-